MLSHQLLLLLLLLLQQILNLPPFCSTPMPPCLLPDKQFHRWPPAVPTAQQQRPLPPPPLDPARAT